MAGRVWTWGIAGSLALLALKPAAAQVGGRVMLPVGIQQFADYTGVLTSFGYQPPRVPIVWMTPNYVVHYEVQQPVYRWVTVERPAAAPERPAVASVETKTLTLGGAALSDAQVTPGAAVTWVNGADREVTLVVARRHQPGVESATPATQWRIGPRGSVCLRLNQPGVYDYHTQAEPERQAQIVVGE